MPRLSSAYQALLRSYVDSVRLNSVSLGAEALYVRLLAVSDGSGRYHGDAAVVAGKAMTLRLKRGLEVEEVEGYLRELEEVGSIVRWSTGPERYLQLRDYFDSGNRQREIYPEPPQEVMEFHPLAGDSHPLLGAEMHPDRGSGIGEQGSGTPPTPPAGGERRGRRGIGPDKLRALADEIALGSVGLEAVLEWHAYRTASRKPLVWATWRRLIKQAAEDERAFAAKVEHSITNGYQGLVAPDDAKRTKRHDPFADAERVMREKGLLE